MQDQESFINYLFSNYQRNCAEKAISPNIANFLDYLLRHGLITKETVRQYTLWQQFRQGMEQGIFHTKTEAVQSLAHRYQVHPNTVWNLIRKAPFQASVNTHYKIDFDP